MVKQLLFICFLWLLFCAQALAQEKEVSGRVTDPETGDGIPGVNIYVKGTTRGTVTDAEGAYRLTAPADAILVFQAVGMLSQEVPVGAQSVIDVKLAPDTKQLNEVVVVGYGTQEKRDITGAIAQVEGSSIANLASPSFAQQLAGRAAGVQVSLGSGLLNQSPRIRIRGTNSITSSADPLVVLDGVPIVSGSFNIGGTTAGTTPRSNPLADINPADIESFEVLKDGSATAIYGSRAANGVILITTKKGKQGSAKINYDMWLGWSEATRKLDVLNAEQYMEISNEKFTNAGQSAFAFPSFNPDGSLVDTDWQDVIFRTGFVQNHAVTVSGGNDKTSYFFSAGWTDQKAAQVSNQLKRGTIRANVDQRVAKWLSIGTNLGFTRSENIGLNAGNNSLSGNVAAALALPPNVAILNPDHPTGYNISPDFAALGQGANTLPVENNNPNIKYVLDNNKENNIGYRVLGNIYGQVNVLNGLVLRSQYGVDGFYGTIQTYWNPTHGDGRGPGGLVVDGKLDSFRWNWQNTLSYNKTIGEVHKFGIVVGNEYQKQRTGYVLPSASALSDAFYGEEGIITGTATTINVSGQVIQDGFDSYFGRINYAFNDKYLASFSIRNDGISDLPKDNRRATFLGGSVGWRISEEGFFKNASFLNFLSDFKLRASYAEVGNTDIGNVPYLGSYASAQYASQNGSSFNNAGNDELKWESSKKLDLGVDIGLLSDRIRLTFDYYRNNVDQLILFAPTPFSFGVPFNGINRNVGSMVNKGIELQVTAEVLKKGAFSWNTEVNFSTNQNEVTATFNNQDIINTFTVIRVGEPVGALYGFKYEGVNPANGFPLFRKGDGSIIQGNPANGAWTFYDPNNPSDASQVAPALNAATDRITFGPANPTWFGGWNNTFRYKGLELQVFLNFSGGNKIMNVTRQENLFEQNRVNNHVDILNRWTTPGQVTDVPRLYANAGNFINQRNATNSRFVENGDFLRIQNIILGYTLPSKLLEKITVSGIRSVRVFAQVQNAFLITKYKGYDPEISLNNSASNFNRGTGSARSNAEFGIDHNGNPPQRTFTVGFNIGF